LCVVSGCPRAKAIFAANEEPQIFLELAFVRREKPDHPAEMIVMTVAQDERIEGRWVDLENGHVVEERFRRVAEIDQDSAHLVATPRLRVHREPPFAIQSGVRRRIRGRVAACSSLNGEILTFFRRNELDDLVIRDHTNGEPIDLRNPRVERLGMRRSRSSD